MKKVTIVGGCGHVGLPLGLALAKVLHDVTLLDINSAAVDMVNAGKIPFIEEGADAIFPLVLNKNFRATTSPDSLKASDVIIFVTGTPVDEHHNPKVHDVVNVIRSYADKINPDALIVLRSTVYPGVMDILHDVLSEKIPQIKLSFCPERIVQGKGIEEIFQLPQLVSGNSLEAENLAADLFSTIAPKIIRLAPKEAEVAKLMINSWRYLEFAIANQFYVMTESQGLDFYKIYDALREDYPRTKHYARPGLAAGPCLFKDTMQLSAFHKSNFSLGQAAMLVNEGLPVFLMEQLETKMGSLKGKTIAILGMTFKANNDDIRESLAFKLRKVLEIRRAKVICSDPYLVDSTPLQEALDKADGIILGVPHNEYLKLNISKPYVDCWGIWRKGK
jgi:UDP-N-acetyl-D-mannosaminuronic acid dehydrogenase